MRPRHARQIRRGLMVARDVLANRRMRPRDLVSFGHAGAPEMPLWQRAYHHEFRRALRDGRIRPPKHLIRAEEDR